MHVIYFDVKAHPTDTWIAQQAVEAFLDDTDSRFLIADLDVTYGRKAFRSRRPNP